MNIKLEITARGGVRMLHDDAVDLRELGSPRVSRASHVEYDNTRGLWTVRSARTKRLLFRAKTRAAALSWEKNHYSPGGKGWPELTRGK